MSDLHETREFEGDETKKLLTTSRSLTTYHPRNHPTGGCDCEKLVWIVSKQASIPPGTDKVKGRKIRKTNAANNEGQTETVRRGEYTMVIHHQNSPGPGPKCSPSVNVFRIGPAPSTPTKGILLPLQLISMPCRCREKKMTNEEIAIAQLKAVEVILGVCQRRIRNQA